MAQGDIQTLFEAWNNALQTGDPKNVVSLYETNAILLPTVSNQVRHNHAEIEDYFVHFLAKEPQGKIDESNVRTFGDMRSTPASTPLPLKRASLCRHALLLYIVGMASAG